ncbi:hypothetical protein QYF61_012290 [Mycteria americana]|uniref:Uncharacterized protein n=1 Tax=Mycteria americana TaxID=33587 RepID=A0AAN7MRS6_MYCAM|nr:hypothetical protein QYF61_012290 [Mycteria americana]
MQPIDFPFFSKDPVDCLVLQLHRIGEQLEKMNSQRMDELFSLLRDGFLLQEGLSSLSQLLLLEIIEFRAADWKMTDAAQKYYYSRRPWGSALQAVGVVASCPMHRKSLPPAEVGISPVGLCHLVQHVLLLDDGPFIVEGLEQLLGELLRHQHPTVLVLPALVSLLDIAFGERRLSSTDLGQKPGEGRDKVEYRFKRVEGEHSPLSYHHLVCELNDVGACTKCTSDQTAPPKVSDTIPCSLLALRNWGCSDSISPVSACKEQDEEGL